MFLTGIADESGKDIHTQIKAHKELGWDKIEKASFVQELPNKGRYFAYN